LVVTVVIGAFSPQKPAVIFAGKVQAIHTIVFIVKTITCRFKCYQTFHLCDFR
jgi:hypothetical protein